MKMKFNKIAIAFAAALLSAGSFAADSATMGVTASIVDECSVGNTAPLAFGNLTMLSNGGTSADASLSNGGGTFDAICTNGSSTPQLKFTSANGLTSSTFRLKGADGTTFIEYTLAESGGTAIVYDTAADFTNFEADGLKKSLTIKGSIAAGEKTGKAKQAYTDTITITATYGI